MPTHDAAVQLTPETYDVLKRMSYFWMDESDVVDGLVAAIGVAATNVRKRLDWLRKLHLIERRCNQTLGGVFELRRIAKE